MRMRLLALLPSIVAVAAVAVAQPVPAASSAAGLAPGDPAPAFSLQGTDGRTYRLEDYKGKQAVVLAWFAKAFSGA
jgi:cytochrome oxidase Cu insertion factor (SCO1/SenC/PrrC family)